MDQQKDTNKAENKGQQQGYSYIVRKAEKLTTALYLVTDILSDKEPIKWRARESGVEVLSDVSVASTASSSEKLTILRGVLKKIERVASFLDIASSSRMMSEMNASVLKREYVSLRDMIEGEWSRTQERGKLLLTDRFFDVPLPDQTLPPRVAHIDEVPKQNVAQIKSTEPQQSFVRKAPLPDRTSSQSTPSSAEQTLPASALSQYQAPRPSIAPLSNVRPQQSFVIPPRPIVIDRQVVERPRVDDSRDDRRKIILALLKQKPAVNVGDIAKSIPGVSEKTIQRELLSMVGEGILLKHGERRWSTYSLRTN